MPFDLQKISRAILASLLALLFAFPPNMLAGTHVVSPSELQKQVLHTSHAREQNLQKVQQFLSSPTAKRALASAHLNPIEVTRATSTLSDAELAELAARADKAQADFAAGAVSGTALILIIVAVAVLILIIAVAR